MRQRFFEDEALLSYPCSAKIVFAGALRYLNTEDEPTPIMMLHVQPEDKPQITCFIRGNLAEKASKHWCILCDCKVEGKLITSIKPSENNKLKYMHYFIVTNITHEL